jgi:hypothetical protein
LAPGFDRASLVTAQGKATSMPGQLRVNFKNFWGLDTSKMVKMKLPGASGGGFTDALLRTGVSAVSGVASPASC